MSLRKRSVIQRLGIVVVLAFLIGIGPAVHVAHAQPVVTYLCVPTGVCDNASLVGLEADSINNVIYAVDDNGEQLLRIDGTNDTYVDSYALSNCVDARRPTVAHDNGTTKIYIGCEDTHEILVLKVTGGRLGTISEVTRVSLAVTYTISNAPATFTYEPKTERANDAVGLVYVAGDNPEDLNPQIACNDPAFAINVHTDTVTHTNATLGTPFGTGCDSENGGATGINDMAFSAKNNRVYWFNEDDHRIYSTNPDLTGRLASFPVQNECDEDVPQHGAVANFIFVLATAEESATPCSTNPETGALFTAVGSASFRPVVIRYQRTQGFGAGPVITISRDNAFLITDRSNPSGLPNCAISCVQVRNFVGDLQNTIPLDQSQTDASNNAPTGKVYLSLDQNDTHDIAIINFGS